MTKQPIPADASAVILEAYIRVLEVRLHKYLWKEDKLFIT